MFQEAAEDIAFALHSIELKEECSKVELSLEEFSLDDVVREVMVSLSPMIGTLNKTAICFW